MAVELNWVDETKTVLHFAYRGRWTWEEVFGALQQSQQMMDTVSHKVATIVDLTDGQKLPVDMMRHMSKIVDDRSKHTNDSGDTVFLNAEALTKAVLNFIEIGNPEAAKFAQFVHATTYNEAVEKAKDLLAKSTV